MFGKNVIWGVDWGATSLKAVQLELAGASAKILDFVTIPIEPSKPEEPPYASLSRAFDEFFTDRKILEESVVISITGKEVFNRFTQVPPVKPTQLKKIVEGEAASVIPFSMDEVSWAFHALPKSPDEDQLTVCIFALKTEILQTLYAALGERRNVLLAVQMQPVGLYNFFDHDQTVDGTTVLLDIGENVSEMIVLDGHGFALRFIRSMRIGGGSLTRALQDKFKIPQHMAEDLKEKLGHNKQAGKVFGVLRPALLSLAEEFRRSLGFYRSQAKGGQIKFKEIVMFGETTKLPGFLKFMERELDIRVRALELPDKVKVNPAIDPSIVPEYMRSHTAAAGLALQGLGLAKVETNFLPSAIRAGKRMKNVKFYSALTTALLLVLLFFSYMWKDRVFSQREQAYKTITEANKIADDYKKMQAKNKQTLEKDVASSFFTSAYAVNERRSQAMVFNYICRRIEEVNRAAREKGLVERGNIIWLRRLNIEPLATPRSVWTLTGMKQFLAADEKTKPVPGASIEPPAAYLKFSPDDLRKIQGSDKKVVEPVKGGQRGLVLSDKRTFFPVVERWVPAWTCEMEIDLRPAVSDPPVPDNDQIKVVVQSLFKDLHDKGILLPTESKPGEASDLNTVILPSYGKVARETIEWVRKMDGNWFDLDWTLVTESAPRTPLRVEYINAVLKFNVFPDREMDFAPARNAKAAKSVAPVAEPASKTVAPPAPKSVPAQPEVKAPAAPVVPEKSGAAAKSPEASPATPDATVGPKPEPKVDVTPDAKTEDKKENATPAKAGS